MITTVVFDLDDTLYDEIEYCRSGFSAVADFIARSFNMPGPKVFEILWRQFSTGNRKNMFNLTLDELGIGYDGKFINELVEVYRNHIPQIILPDESRSVLEQLSNRYTLGLLTDGFLPAQQLKVQALGIKPYFKHIIYTEELGREFWKPSPAGFEKLIEVSNTKPENAACIADNEIKDFIAPNRLGLATIQILRSSRIHTDKSDQSSALPQYVIKKITQLPALLEQL